jgi:phosphatidylserine/phosphatidylglycerophosphate/cardiolipin synthase-like enzyme
MPISSLQRGSLGPISAALDVISKATTTIVLSTHMIDTNEAPGSCLIEAVLESGVTNVRILSNDGPFEKSQVTQLEQLKCRLPFANIRRWSHYLFDTWHMKFIVVDGVHLHVMGANFEEAFTHKETAWRDLGITLVNEPTLAEEALKVFDDIFSKCLEVNRCSPSLEQKALDECDVKRRLHESDVFFWDSSMPQPRTMTLLHKTADHYLPIHSAPLSTMAAIMLDMFDVATETIHIRSPNVIDECVWRHLHAAMQRGVSVHIKTNLGHNVNAARVLLYGQMELNFIDQQIALAPNGLLTIEFNNESKCDAHRRNCAQQRMRNGRLVPVGINHSKYIGVDARLVVIGSFNLEPVSVHTSAEMSLLMNDPIVVPIVDNFFFGQKSQ